MQQPKRVASSLGKQYWAKGTGFGTGSTASSYNMVAVQAKHKSEEKYVSICFAILADFLSWSPLPPPPAPSGVEDKGKGMAVGGPEEAVFAPDGDGVGSIHVEHCTVEVIELLCRSCVLPALASYLLNDSGARGGGGVLRSLLTMCIFMQS